MQEILESDTNFGELRSRQAGSTDSPSPRPRKSSVDVLPVTGVIATRGRPASLCRFLNTLAEQYAQPHALVIIDASDDKETEDLCLQQWHGLHARIDYRRAVRCGAATQRNQGVSIADQPIVWFVDDDVLLEQDCVSRMYAALISDAQLGGINATIINQGYHPPGKTSRFLFRLLAGKHSETWAGRVIGPAINLLPDDNEALPEVVPVEWLNTTCTMYRREALPGQPFPDHFIGYSLMEDVALSLTVAKHWRLANVRTARVFHDSQPGDHKSNRSAMAEMELVNRHYVMTKVLRQTRLRDYTKLAVFELFLMAAELRTGSGRRNLWSMLYGKLRGTRRILCESAS